MKRALLAAVVVAIVACGSGASDAPAEPGSEGEGTTRPRDDTPAVPKPGGDEREGGAALPFNLEARTQRVDGALALRTNLPAHSDACLAVDATETPCEDKDGDGLVDAWEALVLEHLRPRVELDEEEAMLTDAKGHFAIVARVTPRDAALGAKSTVIAYMMLGYARDYGSCGITAHNGDSERVALELRVDGGDAFVRKAYTAAHEGAVTDDGHVYEGAALATDLRYLDEAKGPRWLVFPSANKHATYASIEACEAHSSVPCVQEDCGADGVADRSAYRVLAPFANAGEPSKPLLTDLASVGFPGDQAWADQKFCGGRGGSSCSSPVLEKLTKNPFE